jgi:hypothetical protein
MRKHLPAIFFAALACATPAGAQTTAVPSSIDAGSYGRAKITYCTDEAEAHNVLLAHQASGLAAGIDYIAHSPACRVAVMRFTVLRELAAYPDLPLERGQAAQTFYVIEAEDGLGERLYIVTMIKVAARSVES